MQGVSLDIEEISRRKGNNVSYVVIVVGGKVSCLAWGGERFLEVCFKVDARIGIAGKCFWLVNFITRDRYCWMVDDLNLLYDIFIIY